MSLSEVIFAFSWLILSFVTSLFLYKKFSFFKKIKGVFSLFFLSISFVFLHNLLYFLINRLVGGEEIVFFFLTFLTFGAAIILLLIQTIDKLFYTKIGKRRFKFLELTLFIFNLIFSGIVVYSLISTKMACIPKFCVEGPPAVCSQDCDGSRNYILSIKLGALNLFFWLPLILYEIKLKKKEKKWKKGLQKKKEETGI